MWRFFKGVKDGHARSDGWNRKMRWIGNVGELDTAETMTRIDDDISDVFLP